MTGGLRKRLRLAVFSAFHHVGGIEQTFVQLTRELARRGVIITLVARVENRMRSFVGRLSWIHRVIPWDPGAPSDRILKELCKKSPHVILNTDHFHQTIEVALRLGVPLFWRLGSHPLWWRYGFAKADGSRTAGIVRKIGLFADKVIPISDFIKSAFANEGFQNAETIHEGCDTAFFRPHLRERDDFRKEFSLAPNEIALGVIAGFTWQKRHTLVLKALTHLKRAGLRFRCFFIGGSFGPSMRRQENHVRTLTKKLGLLDRVLFTGFRPNIRQALNGLDIVAFPFLNEGFGLSLVEAMACKKAVLANDSGAFPEIVTGNEDGILVPAESPDRFAEGLHQLMNDPGKRRMLGEKARAQVIQAFSIRRQGHAYLRAFQDYL
jgi:glycosyltransferase involved in cell wall biosynthesis